jgi:DGQHR domain-containing protein
MTISKSNDILKKATTQEDVDVSSIKKKKYKQTSFLDFDSNEEDESEGFAARLIIQGGHRFFTLTLPSDMLAATCVVESRDKNPIDGFQRALDEKRAQEIADYIDSGFGTIPCSIVLSAQPQAELEYISKNQTLRFKPVSNAFLILDGQHRVYGFHKAKSKLRVPVVIYNGLSRADEARLFIDINTKQRPVPNELLLDIRRMADSENDSQIAMRKVFDLFNQKADSPLFGLMSPSSKQKGKISRVTMNAALSPIWSVFGTNSPEEVYEALSAYVYSWIPVLRINEAEANLTNPTLLRAIMLLFPIAAERVNVRHGDEYTTNNFTEALKPLFNRVKKNTLKTPGAKPLLLSEDFKKTLQTSFSMGQSRFD